MIYRATGSFPKEERFGLALQLRRSAVSVPSNIAEGHGRSSKREFARFSLIARGSLKELETQVALATDFLFMSTSDSSEIGQTIQRLNELLTGLLRRLRK